MARITITVQDNGVERKLVLNEPGFNELSAAYMAYLSGYGAGKAGIPDMPKAGKILIDTCCVQGESDKLFFAEGNAKLLFSAALKAAEIIEIFEADLKKN